MRDRNQIKQILKTLLGTRIVNNVIHLKKIPITGLKSVIRPDGTMEYIEEHLAELRVQVELDDFINFYQDILEDESIPISQLLHRCRDKNFSVDPGLKSYIEEWLQS